MCKLCDQYKLGKIDGKEALDKIKNTIKAEMDPNHIGNLTLHMFEMTEMILTKEVPMSESNEELDKAWWNATHGDDDGE